MACTLFDPSTNSTNNNNNLIQSNDNNGNIDNNNDEGDDKITNGNIDSSKNDKDDDDYPRPPPVFYFNNTVSTGVNDSNTGIFLLDQVGANHSSYLAAAILSFGLTVVTVIGIYRLLLQRARLQGREHYIAI